MVHDGTGALVAVAVDGPSGSGKSSTARAVAERLGWNYVDTGAMYRALTWWLIAERVDVDDPEAVTLRAEEPLLDISVDPAARAVFVNGTDVSAQIRDPHVTTSVSAVSAVAAVRKRLVEIQREIMERGPVVVEGRDIGTVVGAGRGRQGLPGRQHREARREASRRVGSRAQRHGGANGGHAQPARPARLHTRALASDAG